MASLTPFINFNQYLRIKCVLAYRFYVNLILKIFQLLLFTPFRNPQKILIFRTGSIGDSICAMPALSNIRKHFSHATIHLLTNAGKGHPNLVSIKSMIAEDIFDEILNYENLSRKELTLKLRNNNYDLIIQLPQYGSSLIRLVRDIMFFRLIAQIPSGFGWQCDNVPFFRKVQEKYLRHSDERSRLNSILQKKGIGIQSEDQFPFQVTADDLSIVSNLLNSLDLPAKPLIAVIPGAKRPQNRWPLAWFSVVIQHFSSDYTIFLLGGPDDESLVTPLLGLPNTYSLCGRLTPVLSGLLMQHCQLVLSNDTGPMHLAYAFGTPVVALFSNRDFPYRWYPPMDGRNKVLRSENIHCSICLSEQCADNICMKRISPAEVIDTLNSMLSDGERN